MLFLVRNEVLCEILRCSLIFFSNKASQTQKPISLVLLLHLTRYVSASEVSGNDEFRFRAFTFSPGTIKSLSINGAGVGVRAGKMYKEKTASKPHGKETKELKWLICQIVYSCALTIF